jgi:hypothetical protein
MKWKVAEVIQETSAETSLILDHGATEYSPENNTRDSVKQEVARGRGVRMKKESTDAFLD